MDRKKNADEKNLCCGCYISNSEIFKEHHGKFDAKKEKERISEIVGEHKDSAFVDRMVKLNKYSQRLDVGGWRTTRDGREAQPKIDKNSKGDYYICPYCNAYRFIGEVEIESGYRYDCCHNGTLRSLIDLESKRKESIFAKYYFGDDKSATLFRNNLKHLNNLFQMTSHGVTPLLKGMKWHECYKYKGATVTIQHGDTYHLLGQNIRPDQDFGSVPKDVNMYANVYYLDQNSQLERRLAVGDKGFLKKIKNPEKKELMKKIIADIQTQLLTHNGFVKGFQDFSKKFGRQIRQDQPRQSEDIKEEEPESDSLELVNEIRRTNQEEVWRIIKTQRADEKLDDKYPMGSMEYEQSLNLETPHDVESHFVAKETALVPDVEEHEEEDEEDIHHLKVDHYDDEEIDERKSLFRKQMQDKVRRVLNEEDGTDFEYKLSFQQTSKNAKTINVEHNQKSIDIS